MRSGSTWVVVETVGVGQVEVEIAGAADTTVVVVNPGWGDAVQANKAGLMEIGDVFVINKADRPGSADTRRDLEAMLSMRRCRCAASGAAGIDGPDRGDGGDGRHGRRGALGRDRGPPGHCDSAAASSSDVESPGPRTSSARSSSPDCGSGRSTVAPVERWDGRDRSDPPPGGRPVGGRRRAARLIGLLR